MFCNLGSTGHIEEHKRLHEPTFLLNPSRERQRPADRGKITAQAPAEVHKHVLLRLRKRYHFGLQQRLGEATATTTTATTARQYQIRCWLVGRIGAKPKDQYRHGGYSVAPARLGSRSHDAIALACPSCPPALVGIWPPSPVLHTTLCRDLSATDTPGTSASGARLHRARPWNEIRAPSCAHLPNAGPPLLAGIIATT